MLYIVVIQINVSFKENMLKHKKDVDLKDVDLKDVDLKNVCDTKKCVYHRNLLNTHNIKKCIYLKNNRS